MQIKPMSCTSFTQTKKYVVYVGSFPVVFIYQATPYVDASFLHNIILFFTGICLSARVGVGEKQEMSGGGCWPRTEVPSA